MRKGLLMLTVLMLAIAVPSAATTAIAAPSAHIAKKKKKKHHHHKPATTAGPSVDVLGFGMNHEYVADGGTISSAADCSTMVQGNGSPYGPPQNIYIEVYVKAIDIPADTPTQIGESDPESDYTRRLTAATTPLSPAVPFSQAFGADTLGFGTPPGSQKDIFRGGLFSDNDPNGPSASDFNGSYSYEVSVDVNGQTLDSTATATVSCS
jgi:hypothetical protein